MLDEMRANDEQFEVSDIRRLESTDAIMHFFARLRYDVDEPLTREASGAYDIGDNVSVLQRVHTHIDADKTDVVHDLLAHLAQQMIDLNKQKPAEVKSFLTWVEECLKIHPDKNGTGGIDSLTGKTILNKVAHDEVLSRDEAQQTRVWAIQILEQV